MLFGLLIGPVGYMLQGAGHVLYQCNLVRPIAPPTIIRNYSLYLEAKFMRAKIEQLKKKGQGLVEYALILVLIAIVVILILTFLGNQVNTTFSKIGSGLKG